MKTKNLISFFLILTVFIFGVPWYWSPTDTTVKFGFPAWVVVSIAASFLLSCITAYLLMKPWEIEESEKENQTHE